MAVCPLCGLPGIPILYGYPSPEGSEKVAAGRLALGGCTVGSRPARFACPRRHGWIGDGEVPDDAEPAGAARMHAAGDLDGAAAAYRAALAASVRTRGEDDPETLILRHALSIVLADAGRIDEADAAYAPVREARYRTLQARHDELRRRLPPPTPES